MKELDVEYKTEVVTDVATIAIFDPSVLSVRKHADADWWTAALENLEEVRDGRVAMFSTGSDGAYGLRLTSGALTKLERANAVDVLDGLGVEVSSGKLYIGDASNIPGGGVDDCRGLSIDFPNGRYQLTAYALNQPDKQEVADIVVTIRHRKDGEKCSADKLGLEWSSDGYLFVEKPKPKLGRKLNGKVWRTDRTESGLIIKDSDYSWPSSHFGYDAILRDMTQVQRGDKVQVKTIDLDEENKLLICDLIKRVPKE